MNTYFSGIRTRKMLLVHFLSLKTKVKKKKMKATWFNRIFFFTLTPKKFLKLNVVYAFPSGKILQGHAFLGLSYLPISEASKALTLRLLQQAGLAPKSLPLFCVPGTALASPYS